MSCALIVFALVLILELKWDLFQLLPGSFGEEMALVKDVQLGRGPVRIVRANDQFRSSCSRDPEELVLAEICTNILHTSCTATMVGFIASEFNNIYDRNHPLRMTVLVG